MGEEDLLKIARKRVGFKVHLIIYILGNLLLWVLYFLFFFLFDFTFPWAIFPTLIWSIALGFHYFVVFKWNEKWVEKEYQKLVKEQSEFKNKNI
ncbi:MAG: 2TM domain-containing protein [Bacteroidales bacterium]|nr:2TM domain-containing protein [Bacteroidales bacterium]